MIELGEWKIRIEVGDNALHALGCRVFIRSSIAWNALQLYHFGDFLALYRAAENGDTLEWLLALNHYTFACDLAARLVAADICSLAARDFVGPVAQVGLCARGKGFGHTSRDPRLIAEAVRAMAQKAWLSRKATARHKAWLYAGVCARLPRCFETFEKRGGPLAVAYLAALDSFQDERLADTFAFDAAQLLYETEETKHDE